MTFSRMSAPVDASQRVGPGSHRTIFLLPTGRLHLLIPWRGLCPKGRIGLLGSISRYSSCRSGVHPPSGESGTRLSPSFVFYFPLCGK